jgi:hypothetical protein
MPGGLILLSALALCWLADKCRQPDVYDSLDDTTIEEHESAEDWACSPFEGKY